MSLGWAMVSGLAYVVGINLSPEWVRCIMTNTWYRSWLTIIDILNQVINLSYKLHQWFRHSLYDHVS